MAARTTARDIDDSASILGLRKAATRVQTRGTSAEGFAYHAGSLADTATGGIAAALLLGSFEVEPELSRYAIFGSPTRKLAEHLRQAVPLMTRLSGLR